MIDDTRLRNNPISRHSITNSLAYITQTAIDLQYGWRILPRHLRHLANRIGYPDPTLRRLAAHRQLALYLVLLATARLIILTPSKLVIHPIIHRWLQHDPREQYRFLRNALDNVDDWTQQVAKLHLQNCILPTDRHYLQQQLDRLAQQPSRPKRPFVISSTADGWRLHCPTTLDQYTYYHLQLASEWVNNRLLHLTPLTLAQAAILQISRPMLEAFLSHAMEQPLAADLQAELRAWEQRNQAYRLQATFLLETDQRTQLDTIMARRHLRKHIHQRISPRHAVVSHTAQAPLKKWLATQQIALQISSPPAATYTADETDTQLYLAAALAQLLTKRYQLPHLKPHIALSHFSETLTSTQLDPLDQNAQQIMTALERAITGYDNSGTVGAIDPDQLARLYTALEQESTVTIRYHGARDHEPRSRTIDPHWIDMRSPGYLHAYCERVGDNRVFRLDRIHHVELL